MLLHALQIEQIRASLTDKRIPTWTPIGPDTGVHAIRVELSPENSWRDVSFAPAKLDEWHCAVAALSFVDPGQMECTRFDIANNRLMPIPFDPAMWHTADRQCVKITSAVFSNLSPLQFRFELDALDIAMMDLLIVVQAVDPRLCRTPKHA